MGAVSSAQCEVSTYNLWVFLLFSTHTTWVTHPCSPMPLCSLLAVGPPLLTLVNFEVENLAYMLVCMQWTVSRYCSGPQACSFLGECFRGEHSPSLRVNECMCVH